MRRTMIAVLAVLVALPALAGESDKKCSYSTQECLDHFGKMRSAGWVGIELDHHAVKSVIEGSPAAAAGLQAGDVLHALNGVVIAKATDEELAKARAEWKPGQVVHYTIQRSGQEKQVDLTLGSWPADQLAKTVGKHMLQHASTEDVATTK